MHYSSPLCLANCFGHNNNAQTASFKTYALKSCACSLYKRSREQPKVETEAQFWNRSSILKWKLDFEIEVQFWNQSSILKLKFHSEIKARFCNRSFILKIEVWFWNRGSFLKLKLDFEIKAHFELWNWSSISKFDFEIETWFWNRSLIWKSKLNPLTNRFRHHIETSQLICSVFGEASFENWSSNFKSKLHFEIQVRFENRSLILK